MDARAKLAVPFTREEMSHVAPTASFMLPQPELSGADAVPDSRQMIIHHPGSTELIYNRNAPEGRAEYFSPR